MKNNLDNHVRAYEGELQYDFDNEVILNWYPKRIINLADKTSKILELGLGHGYTTDIFSRYFGEHTILEGSPAVIENFKKRYPDSHSKIVETYFEEYTSDEQYDIIIMGFILEHVDDPRQILGHFKKFLKPGGKMYLSVPNSEVLNRRLGNIMGLLPDMQALSENDHILGHQRYYTVKTLQDDIEASGYKTVRMEGIYLKPLTTQQILSLNLDPKAITALCEIGVNYPELSCGILAEIGI